MRRSARLRRRSARPCRRRASRASAFCRWGRGKPCTRSVCRAPPRRPTPSSRIARCDGWHRGLGGRAGPGSPPGIAARRAASAPGSSAGASGVPTVGSAIGPAILRARGSRPRRGRGRGAARVSVAGARERARRVCRIACRVRGASRPPPRWRARLRSPRIRPSRGSARRCRRRSRACPAPHSAPRMTGGVVGRSWSAATSSSRPEQGAGRASAGDPSLRVAVGSELGAAVSAAPPRRPGTGLRAADERAAIAGRSWSGRALVPARAGGRTCERSGPRAAGRGRAGDRAPLRDELDGLGEGGSETGDGRAIAVSGPRAARSGWGGEGLPGRARGLRALGRRADRRGDRQPARPVPAARLATRSPSSFGPTISARCTWPPDSRVGRLTLEIRAELAAVARPPAASASPAPGIARPAGHRRGARDHPPGPRHRRPGLFGAAFRRAPALHARRGASRRGRP